MLFWKMYWRTVTPKDEIVRHASTMRIGADFNHEAVASFARMGMLHHKPPSDTLSSSKSTPLTNFREISPPRANIPEEKGEEASPRSAARFTRSVTGSVTAIKDDSKAGPQRQMSNSAILSPATTARAGDADPDSLTIPGNELIQLIGVSGMCAFPSGEVDSITHIPEWLAVPVLFLQAAGLQASLLYYMWVQLSPREDDVHSPPRLLTFVAIYLHFLSCIQELPYSMQVFRYFIDFHDDVRDIICFGIVVIADGFVIPLLCFVLGALYLCTSSTVADVILKAVSVSFVTEIDAWIISFAVRAGLMGGNKRTQAVKIPVSPQSMRALMICVVYCPIVPACCSLLGVWAGVSLLKL
jgi:hypothetical protein